jgi:hypothetical protein
MELDKVPLWRGEHVAIRQLAEDFARYLYLPKLRDTEVLYAAVRDGLSLLLWKEESFAYADSFDEGTGRYRGLRDGRSGGFLVGDLPGLLVKPATALKQLEADRAEPRPTDTAERSKRSGSGGMPGGSPTRSSRIWPVSWGRRLP